MNSVDIIRLFIGIFFLLFFFCLAKIHFFCLCYWGKGDNFFFYDKCLLLNLASVEHEILFGYILGEGVVCHLGA